MTVGTVDHEAGTKRMPGQRCGTPEVFCIAALQEPERRSHGGATTHAYFWTDEFPRGSTW